MIATMGGVGSVCMCDLIMWYRHIYYCTPQGSLTGGFLAHPTSKYPLFDVPFFCDFPYLLPCLIGVSTNIFNLISKWSCMPHHVSIIIDSCSYVVLQTLAKS